MPCCQNIAAGDDWDRMTESQTRQPPSSDRRGILPVLGSAALLAALFLVPRLSPTAGFIVQTTAVGGFVGMTIAYFRRANAGSWRGLILRWAAAGLIIGAAASLASSIWT